MCEDTDDIHVISISFQSFGYSPHDNGFCQLAASVVSMDGKVTRLFNYYAKQNGYTQNEECIKEQWNEERYNHVTKRTTESTLDPYEVAKIFITWVTPYLRNCYCISENAFWDTMMLSHFLRGVIPFRMIDASSYYYGMGYRQYHLGMPAKATALRSLRARPPSLLPNTNNDAKITCINTGLIWVYIQKHLQC
jgi:hypothetical protein